MRVLEQLGDDFGTWMVFCKCIRNVLKSVQIQISPKSFSNIMLFELLIKYIRQYLIWNLS